MKPIIDVALVEKLVAGQFPQWVGLPVRPVEFSGWDNRTFRLGEEMSVRLPSAVYYAGQVEKEHCWLPYLAPQLPLAILVPLALGDPAEGYSWHWSVTRWLDGEIATVGHVADKCALATALGEFLAALHRIDASEGPPAGKHSFFRGGSMSVYDGETRDALAALEGKIDTHTARAVWEEALRSRWEGPPVWVHGDVHPTNLLVVEGRLNAVVDFGCCAVGDPACDLAIAWNFFSGESREAFHKALPLDDATWARGRGWTLWKALIILAGRPGANLAEVDKASWVIDEVIADALSS